MVSVRTKTLWSVGGAFFAYAYLSLLWSPEAIYSGVYLISLGLAFLLGILLPSPRPVWQWFCVALSLNAVGYLCGFPFNGWFGNLNFAGCAFAFALAGAFVYRISWFYPFAGIGIYLSQSRAALVAVAVICLIWLWQRAWPLALAIAVACAILATTQKEDFFPFFMRLGIWQDTLNHLSPLGHGWGSFAPDYAKFPIKTNMPFPQVAGHSYNDFIELVFELGIFAGLFWVLAISGLERQEWPILLAYLTLSLTYFPLAIIGIGQMLMFTIGQTTRSNEWTTLSQTP